ncbi:Drug/metabolite transporter [Macleaya cordata]|uniref:Probable purine permease n=1 Tax=Macleaya cordata TaxID=56857 RepID=A0A200QXZ4_MACCD|nr:Drug/metabolite transporter [Macleaya cordata]
MNDTHNINNNNNNNKNTAETMVQQQEVEGVDHQLQTLEKDHLKESRKRIKWWLFLINCVLATTGTVGGPLTIRLYYQHGGSRRWLPTWLQTAGFPFLLIPCIILYVRNRSNQTNNQQASTFYLRPKLLIFSAVIGLVIGVDNFMYSSGLSYIPLSTSSILFSTQLAFTAIFALILVKQKFTPYSINAVLLMTLGAILLGLRKGGDRPPNVNDAQYLTGFFLTLGGAALLGIYLPLIELAYVKGGQEINFSIVTQVQIVTSLSATIFSSIGMLINHDFQAIPKEAKEFGLGEVKYYMVLVACAIMFQLLIVGSLGVIFCSSSLLCGIITTSMIPVTEIFSAILFKEKFNGEKGLSLILCLWGVTSYFYGVYRMSKKNIKNNKTESSPDSSPPLCDIVSLEDGCLSSPSKNTTVLTPGPKNSY